MRTCIDPEATSLIPSSAAAKGPAVDMSTSERPNTASRRPSTGRRPGTAKRPGTASVRIRKEAEIKVPLTRRECCYFSSNSNLAPGYLRLGLCATATEMWYADRQYSAVVFRRALAMTWQSRIPLVDKMDWNYGVVDLPAHHPFLTHPLSVSSTGQPGAASEHHRRKDERDR